MAKFKLSTDKQLLVGGVIVNLKAGDHETKDKDMINALSKALNVEEVKSKPKAKVKD